MTERHLIAISAGISQPSSTSLLADRLLEATTTHLGDVGLTATVEVIELRTLAHEVMNAMLTGFATGELRAAIDHVIAADGVIAVTPLFTTTYSGLFKSFIDVLDKDSLQGMPVLIGATGGSPRHSLALDYSMRPLFTYLHADVATTSVFAATDDWAMAGGDVSGQGAEGADLHARISRASRELAQLVAGRPLREVVDEFASTPPFLDLLGRS